MVQAIKSFEEFWPHYLRDHSAHGTRALHYVGYFAAIGLALTGAVVFSDPWFVLYGIVVGYAFSWIGHIFIEGNVPATFGHPIWSFRADLRMCHLWLSGGLAAELEKAGIKQPQT